MSCFGIGHVVYNIGEYPSQQAQEFVLRPKAELCCDIFWIHHYFALTGEIAGSCNQRVSMDMPHHYPDSVTRPSSKA